jgi:hypothetical protein
LYEGRGWNKIQDHINFVISRLQYGLNDVRQALEHIERILNRRPLKTKLLQQQQQNNLSTATSENHHHHHHHRRHQQQSSAASRDFLNEMYVLRDFITYNNLEQVTVKSLPVLPLPTVNFTAIQVNLAPSKAKELRFGSILASTSIDNLSLEHPMESFVPDISPTESGVDNKTKEIWQKLEESAYIHAYRTSLPILFKPHTTLFSKYTDNKHMPKVIVDEPVDLLFTVSNNLGINLFLGDITLLWKFVDQAQPSNETTSSFEESNELIDSSSSPIVECSNINELKMASGESYKLLLRVVPRRAHGHLQILGIKYRLILDNNIDTIVPLSASTSMQSISTTATTVSNVSPISFALQSNSSGAEGTPIDKVCSLYGKQLFELRGPRLNNTPQVMRSVVYDTDNRLNLKILNKAPLLQVEMDRLPTEMISGQIERIRLFMINTSNQMYIGNMRIASYSIEQSNLWFYETKSSIKSFNTMQSKQMSCFSKSEFKLADPISIENGTESKSGYTVFSYSHSHSAALDKAGKSINPSNVSDQISQLVYSLEGVVLKPGEHYELDMYIRGPESNNNNNEHTFRLLFFYDEAFPNGPNPKTNAQTNSHSGSKRNSISANVFKYRIIRCEFLIKTLKCLNMLGTLKAADSNTSSSMLINTQVANQSFAVS